jgi:hypothetical protein
MPGGSSPVVVGRFLLLTVNRGKYSESAIDLTDEIRRCSTIKQSETRKLVLGLLRDSVRLLWDSASTFRWKLLDVEILKSLGG